MKIFWDIESYYNLFCAALLDDNDFLEMFYIVNSPEDEAEVFRACKMSGYEFKTYDLTKDMSRFKWHFEKRIPKPATNSLLSDFLGIDDTPVEPKENWYIGYNTLNYDIQMIDNILNSSLANRVQTSTETLRKFSDTLINDTARRINTKAYEQYANQVDAAFLNETMVDKGKPTIGLKTLVGVKGGSIIESESNKSGHSKDIYFDVLYNINDVKELRDVVYLGKMEYTFNIRTSLLERFPSLKENNITVNSTSAKFVEFIVSPNRRIDDLPTVSFMYPAKHIAEELGVEQKDMLEYTKDWYMENVFQVVAKHNPTAAKNHLAKFMSVYEYYASFRGKNWNDSTNHLMIHGINPEPKANRRKLLDDFGTFIPFIDKYGNDSGTYANFSAGGIHGAEIYQKQLADDRAKIAELREKYGKISMIPKGIVSQKLLNLIKYQSRTQYKNYPVHLSHEIPLFAKNTKQVDEILDPNDFTPYQYDETKGTEVLIDRYKFTSTGFSVHQDFAGYYPMLLINLGAFYDGHGKDNYHDVYNFRISVKSKLKTLKFNSPEWIATNIEQEGYKLILNSASGVLDGSFDTNLRANNKALSMRIIGQLFTYIIGAALAVKSSNEPKAYTSFDQIPDDEKPYIRLPELGFHHPSLDYAGKAITYKQTKIPSSNTDGIYVFDINDDENKAIVDYELEKLLVAIDPEPVFLVSKDANNRMELEEEPDGSYKVVSARGGTLTSWGGARVDNRLSHPALVDKVMTIYLQNDNIVNRGVNKELIRKAIYEYIDELKGDKRQFVLMSSWVLRSTSGSIFIDDQNQIYPGTIRAWLSNDGVHIDKYGTRKTKMTKSVKEYASKLFADTKLGDPDIIEFLTDLDAIDKYFDKAINAGQLKEYEESNMSGHIVAKMKVSNLSDSARLHIDNNSVLKMSDQEIEHIYNQLSIDEYVDMIEDFAKVWSNELKKP